MTIAIKTKMTESRPPEVSQRAWRGITRDAHAAQGLGWVQQFLPLHFKPFSATKYKYRRRSPNYLARKERDADAGRIDASHANLPLVRTGNMRDVVLHIAYVKPFPSRVRIDLNGPDYLRMRPRTFKLPDMAKEIFTVLPSEQRTLEATLDRKVTEGIEKTRQPKVTTNT